MCKLAELEWARVRLWGAEGGELAAKEASEQLLNLAQLSQPLRSFAHLLARSLARSPSRRSRRPSYLATPSLSIYPQASLPPSDVRWLAPSLVRPLSDSQPARATIARRPLARQLSFRAPSESGRMFAPKPGCCLRAICLVEPFARADVGDAYEVGPKSYHVAPTTSQPASRTHTNRCRQNLLKLAREPES